MRQHIFSLNFFNPQSKGHFERHPFCNYGKFATPKLQKIMMNAPLLVRYALNNIFADAKTKKSSTT